MMVLVGTAPRADDIALVTTGEAATKANVPARRIRVWAHRGLIQPVSRTTAGRPLYALRQVWDVELATRSGRGPARSVVDAGVHE